MIRTLLKPLSFVPALLLMYMIFSFSAQPAEVSSQVSYKVSYKMVEAADYVFDADLDEWQMSEWATKINFITRKLAHMTEYFALAIAVSFPLYVYGLHGILLMLTAGMICVAFACGDEYHQSFVSGRSPSMKDVGIDSIGVFFGIILVRIIGWTGRKTIFRPRKKKDDYEDRAPINYREDDVELYRNAYREERYDDRYDRRRDYRENERYKDRYDDPYDDRRSRRNEYRDSYRDDRTYDSGYYHNNYPHDYRDDYRDDHQDSYYFDEETPDTSDYREHRDSADSRRYERSYAYEDMEDLSRKDDWGMDDTPSYREPIYTKSFYEEQERQERTQKTKKQPAKKKRRKKEKDWFFDM
jgi:VanZ family protein